MYSVFFKCYYRPSTEIPVGFCYGYTDKQFKIISNINGLTVDRIFIPAKAIIQYNGYYQGEIVSGSEECRFRAGNSDYFLYMYLIIDKVSEAQAIHYMKTTLDKTKNSDLYMRA